MTMSRILTSSNLATGAMSATASTSGSANPDNIDGSRKDKVVLHYALFPKRQVRSTKDRSHHRRMQEDRADSHSTLDTEDPSSSLHDEALLVDLRECSNNTTNRNDQSWSRMFANPNDIFGKMPIPIKPTVSKDDDSSSRWAYMTAPEYEQSSVRSGVGAVPLTSSLLPQPPAVARPLMMDIPWMAPSEEDDRGDGGDGAENNIYNNDNTKSSDQVPLLRLAMSSSSSVSPSPPRQAPPPFAVVQHQQQQQPNQTCTAAPCPPPTPPRSVHWLLLVWKQSKTLWCWRRQTSIGGTHRHRHHRRSTSTLPPPSVATPPVIAIPLELQMEALVKGEIDGFVLQFPCSAAAAAATTRSQTDAVSTSLGKIELDCCSILTEPKYY